MEENKIHENIFLVGIGVSTKGFLSLKKFIKSIDDFELPISFVVIQDVLPSDKVLDLEEIKKETKLQVLKIENNMEMQGKHIYICPPFKYLQYKEKKFILIESNTECPVNYFFSYIAEKEGKKASVIIFDGISNIKKGIMAVKNYTGMTILENIKNGQFNETSIMFIKEGLAEHILDIEDMLDVLLKHIELIADTKKIQIINI